MAETRVLYDGWPLARAGNSPAALHLLAILAHLPDGFELVLALPEDPPPWIPDRAQVHVERTGDTPRDRLRWEQQMLPRLADSLGCEIIHLTGQSPPLFRGQQTVVSPSGYERDASPGKGFWTRLRGAMGQGGMAQAERVLWPRDLVPHPKGKSVSILPPAVHPSFTPKEYFWAPDVGFDLPDAYVLYHGPQDEASLNRALSGWTWPAGSMGDAYQLLMVGLDEAAKQKVAQLAPGLKVDEVVTVAPTIHPDQLAAVYQFASAVFHPAGVSPWGGAVRHALACGKPVVALETPAMNTLVGPAAFLAPIDKPRDLGAGLITVLVRDDLPKQLRDAALDRSKGWTGKKFGGKLAEVYRGISDRGGRV